MRIRRTYLGEGFFYCWVVRFTTRVTLRKLQKIYRVNPLIFVTKKVKNSPQAQSPAELHTGLHCPCITCCASPGAGGAQYVHGVIGII